MFNKHIYHIPLCNSHIKNDLVKPTAWSKVNNLIGRVHGLVYIALLWGDFSGYEACNKINNTNCGMIKELHIGIV